MNLINQNNSGVLIMDKPAGMSSYDVIRHIKRRFNMPKIGHAGTLDPLASGVLVILIGSATKSFDSFLKFDKEYIAKLNLGVSTDTLDADGRVLRIDVEFLNNPDIPCGKDWINKVKETLNSFLGEQYQDVPIYSAAKVNGVPMYKLARKNKTDNLEPKKKFINLKDIELLDIASTYIVFRVVCSSGTYIRTLCNDIALKLGTIGHMMSLSRTRVGQFSLDQAHSLDDLAKIDLLENWLIDMSKTDGLNPNVMSTGVGQD